MGSLVNLRAVAGKTPQNEKLAMDDLKLRPETLAEMIQLIDDGTISGKIGKEILPKLLQVHAASFTAPDQTIPRALPTARQ